MIADITAKITEMELEQVEKDVDVVRDYIHEGYPEHMDETVMIGILERWERAWGVALTYSEDPDHWDLKLEIMTNEMDLLGDAVFTNAMIPLLENGGELGLCSH